MTSYDKSDPLRPRLRKDGGRPRTPDEGELHRLLLDVALPSADDRRLKLVEAVMRRAEGTPMSLDRLRERASDLNHERRQKARQFAPALEWAYLVANAYTAAELNARLKHPPLLRAIRAVAVLAGDEIDDLPETTAEVLAEHDRDYDERIDWMSRQSDEAYEQLDQMSSEFGGGPVGLE